MGQVWGRCRQGSSLFQYIFQAPNLTHPDVLLCNSSRLIATYSCSCTQSFYPRSRAARDRCALRNTDRLELPGWVSRAGNCAPPAGSGRTTSVQRSGCGGRSARVFCNSQARGARQPTARPVCLSHASREHLRRRTVCRMGRPVAVQPSRATFVAGRQCSPFTKVFTQCQAFTPAIQVLAVASITHARSAPATEITSSSRRDSRSRGASGATGAPSLARRQAHCARSSSRARRCSGPIGHGPLR